MVWRAGVLAAALLAAAPAAAAQDGTDKEGDSNAQVTLYGWLAGATGKLRPVAAAPTLEFDNSVGDVLDDLDVAFFASAQMRRDRFVAVADVSYASLSRDGIVPPGIPASGKISQLAVTALAGARIGDGADTSVCLLAGGRLWNLDLKVDVPLAGVSASPDTTFVDPIVAMRINAGIAPRLSALVQGDVGGFGVGFDFTYQLVGTLNYRFARSTWISAGWRHLYLDYRSGGTRFEGSQTGPLIGVTQRF